MVMSRALSSSTGGAGLDVVPDDSAHQERTALRYPFGRHVNFQRAGSRVSTTPRSLRGQRQHALRRPHRAAADQGHQGCRIPNRFPASSGPLSPSPALPGSGCHHLQPHCCDGGLVRVYHLHANQRRLTTQAECEPEPFPVNNREPVDRQLLLSFLAGILCPAPTIVPRVAAGIRSGGVAPPVGVAGPRRIESRIARRGNSFPVSDGPLQQRTGPARVAGFPVAAACTCR